MAGKREQKGVLDFRIFVLDAKGEEREKIGRRTMHPPLDMEAALDIVGVRSEFIDGQNGRYVFNFEPDFEWHTDYSVAVSEGKIARMFSDPVEVRGIRVSLIDSNGRLLLFKDTVGKDDIASALRFFRGDVAAAAKYLKGRQ